MGKFKKINFYKLAEDIVANATADREKASKLLKIFEDNLDQGNINNQEHGFVGSTIAKYLEVRARANEQLVKLASLVRHKDEADKEQSEAEVDEMYQSIGEN